VAAAAAAAAVSPALAAGSCFFRRFFGKSADAHDGPPGQEAINSRERFRAVRMATRSSSSGREISKNHALRHVTASTPVPPSVVVNTNRATGTPPADQSVGNWASSSSDGALDGAQLGSLDIVLRRAGPGGMLHHKFVPLGALPPEGRMKAVGASATGLTLGSMVERGRGV